MFDLFFDMYKQEETCRVINMMKDNWINGVILCGVGKNWYVCEKVYKTYISLGIACDALDPTHALHGDIGMIKNQTIFFVSKSGTTTELVMLIKYLTYLRSQNIIHPKFVGIFLKNNETCKMMDYNIIPKDGTLLYEFDNKDIIPTLSINILQMLLDYIAVRVFETNQTLIDNYKYNHPAGSIGALLKSQDLLE